MIRFGIVGCGNIGSRHAAHLQKLSGAELVALFDINKAAAQQVSESFSGKLCSSLDELLALDLDIVSVCTPNGDHYTTGKTVLLAGKNVLIEKPMTIAGSDAEDLLKISREKNLKLFVVKQNRFNPPVHAVKKILDQGKLGKINSVMVNCLWNRNEQYYQSSEWRGTKALDGGTLFTQFSHFVDVLYYLFGDVEPIAGVVDNVAHKGVIEFEDTGHFIFRLKGSDTIGSFNYTTAAYRENVEGSIAILAEKGSVKIGGKYLNTIDYQVSDDFVLEDVPRSNPANNYGFYEGSMSNHDKMLANVIAALNGEEQIMAGGKDGAKVVEIIEAFYKIAKAPR